MICIIDCGTSYLDYFQKHLGELGCQFKIISMHDAKKCDFKPFSGIIISGGSTLLSQFNAQDLQEFLISFKFVKEAHVPVLGVCLGHQAIGLLYGSEIHHYARVRKKESIDFLTKDQLFSGLEGGSLFQEDHSEHITLPEGFMLLAKSGSCNNEAMKHKEKAIYGVQFHPEASGDNGKIILKNFARMCDALGR